MIKKYVVYDKSSGEILFNTVTDEGSIIIAAGENEYVEGSADDTYQYVREKEIKDLTDKELSNKKNKPNSFSKWDWSTLSWKITADIEEARSKRSNEVRISTARAIQSGFQSSALGDLYAYPTDDKTQFNLSASVIASLLPHIPDDWTTNFWCKDVNGLWQFLPHTASQIQQVGIEMKSFVVAQQQKYAELLSEIYEAKTSAEIDAIIW